jgi:phage tail-like protein
LNADGRPAGNHRFLVDLGDRADPYAAGAGFSEVVFPRFEVHEGVTEPRLVLRRGATGARNLYQRWDKAPRRTVRVTLLGDDGATPVMRWRFVDARPVALEYGALDANAPTVLLESIELVYERIEIES